MNFDWVEFQYNSRPKIRGVYAIQLNGQWLYIGKTKSISHRLGSFAHTACTMSLELSGVKYFSIETNNNEEVETLAIKHYQPIWQSFGGENYWLTSLNLNGKEVLFSSLDCPLPEFYKTFEWD